MTDQRQPVSEVYNCDCMEFMRTLPDKFFELAIVDPPYGIGANKMTLGNGKQKINRGTTNWDHKAPNSFYFDLLQIKSKNKIIWGANHFLDNIPFNINSPCWIIWDKGTGDNDYADAEIAWTSFSSVIKIFKKSWVGANAKDELKRIHPTQKPVALYKWLLRNYANPGDKIFDSHMGSQSSRIAAWDGGFDYWGCELDKDYFDAGCKRFENHVKQLKLELK